MALGALHQTHEQLRLAAVEAQQPRFTTYEHKRFHSANRRQWLIEVGKQTEAHREFMASKHAVRAWYELQPRHEELEDKRDRPPAPAVQLTWCECAENKTTVDVFGADEPEHWLPFHGLKQCTLEDCGGILEPTSEHGWKVYADAMLERTRRAWCDCSSDIAHVERKGLTWCENCAQPAAPHPFNDSEERCVEVYRRVTDLYYSGAVMRFTRLLEATQGAVLEHWRQTGWDNGRSPESETRKLEELAAAAGLDAPYDVVRPGAKPGDPKAPRGSVSGYHWHKQREKGQLEKIDRVFQCGSKKITHVCTACTHTGPKIDIGCDNHRLCHRCRDKRKGKFQRAFQRGQREVLQRLWNDPLRLQRTHTFEREDGTKRLAYGGQWGEKFLTLTLPHSGNARQDVRELQRAWQRFWRLLRTHVAKDVLREESKAIRAHLMTQIAYCRVLEVTPGQDWKGHAHCHVWFTGPFIHHEMIRYLWGKALSTSYQHHLVESEMVVTVDQVVAEMPASRKRYAYQLREWLVTRRGRNGRPLALVWWPVIDVQQIRSAEIGQELCKYLVKDGERDKRGELKLIDPEVFSRIYAALEATRTICTSRGLLVHDKEGCFCPRCGGQYRKIIKDEPPEELAPRGPPDDQLELELDEQGGQA